MANPPPDPLTEYRDPITVGDILRVGREMRKLRGTIGFQMFRDMMAKRIQALAIDCLENTDPKRTPEYWKGRVDEIRDLFRKVDLLVADAGEQARMMRETPEFADQYIPALHSPGSLVSD